MQWMHIPRSAGAGSGSGGESIRWPIMAAIEKLLPLLLLFWPLASSLTGNISLSIQFNPVQSNGGIHWKSMHIQLLAIEEISLRYSLK